MKKHLLSIMSLIAACTISATQYMHVNLPNGKEYDVKIEKTDHVSHVKQGDEVFIKVTRKDNSYSLYPSTGAEVTFDEEIARMDGDHSNWNVLGMDVEGCVLDTSRANFMRLAGVDQWEIERALMEAQQIYNSCIWAKQKETGIQYSDIEENTLISSNKSATDLFVEISNNEEFRKENLIFSPTSLQYALAMLANGADDDDAYAEITKFLGNQDMPLDQLNELYKKRLTKMQMVNPSEVQLGIANAVFLQNGIPFGKNFLQNIEDFYKGSANNVDFTDDSTYVVMDKWASDNTNGMIPTIGLQKDPSLWLVLANALSFQSEWEDKFMPENTKPGKFLTSEGDSVIVDKMNRAFEGNYAEGSNYQLVSLSFYEGFQMNVILPNEGIDPLSTLAEIDFDNINYKYDENPNQDVMIVYCPILSLPKFNIDTKIDLKAAMCGLGLTNTFESYFNNIANSAIVSKIDQLAHLEIDEEGAKGAAVTVIPMVGSCLKEFRYIDFDVNRPFIVTINNPRSHELLFIGLINDPTK